MKSSRTIDLVISGVPPMAGDSEAILPACPCEFKLLKAIDLFNFVGQSHRRFDKAAQPGGAEKGTICADYQPRALFSFTLELMNHKYVSISNVTRAPFRIAGLMSQLQKRSAM